MAMVLLSEPKGMKAWPQRSSCYTIQHCRQKPLTSGALGQTVRSAKQLRYCYTIIPAGPGAFSSSHIGGMSCSRGRHVKVSIRRAIDCRADIANDAWRNAHRCEYCVNRTTKLPDPAEQRLS